jgi:2-haloacid dehalogenase
VERRLEVIVLDVNETLSDTSALAARFEDVGAPGHLAATWFAQVLRDGFALAVTGTGAPFATVAGAVLDAVLAPIELARPYDAVKEHLLAGFAELPLHPDVGPGLRRLAQAGPRLVALTNGSTATVDTLLGAAGLDGVLDRVLSVEDAPTWKPGPEAYRSAASACSVEPAAMMLVAVHPWDVHGAAHAGLRTAWVDRTGQPYPPYFTAPDLTVPSLTALADRLG